MGVVRLLVSQRVKGNGCNILDADEWNFTVAETCVDLALVFDGGKMCSFGEVFYSPVIHDQHCKLRQKRTHEPSW